MLKKVKLSLTQKNDIRIKLIDLLYSDDVIFDNVADIVKSSNSYTGDYNSDDLFFDIHELLDYFMHKHDFYTLEDAEPLILFAIDIKLLGYKNLFASKLHVEHLLLMLQDLYIRYDGSIQKEVKKISLKNDMQTVWALEQIIVNAIENNVVCPTCKGQYVHNKTKHGWESPFGFALFDCEYECSDSDMQGFLFNYGRFEQEDGKVVLQLDCNKELSDYIEQKENTT